MPAPKIRSQLLAAVPVLITLAVVAAAIPFARKTWDVYMATPWTRDGAVRAYVVTLAPEVAGRIVELPIADNMLVRKDQLLMVIDPTEYAIAVRLAEAAADQERANADNLEVEAQRRQQLSQLATSVEVQQTYASKAISARAVYRQALANLERVRVNLKRTHIYSPVNGYVTNLLARTGDYASVGRNVLSIVDVDSFWVDAYFEETSLHAIEEGDPVRVKLMGYTAEIQGHVGSVARGIDVANARAGQGGLASINPIFTWVRLAQRVPVRVEIDHVPAGIRLVQGMTATVEVLPRGASKDSPRLTRKER
ncbi:RND family efflux transporter, MFP subunit [Enhydrobacter aerosaccus]|uniref:RND family efflux transporter, MFP subunit n=1 Tax=Enhydrobacter aerosaccus TaxID=225324 RepID=A0A1T4SNS4_9HYPH|nr:HlyD family secretion protein [Enhydrobacter aerosaccus]SKA29910.1 RND family efflux transporter, MFP subunit [Enhydrobacter aerosaccus]